jgi:phospholipase/carboxylesterase
VPLTKRETRLLLYGGLSILGGYVLAKSLRKDEEVSCDQVSDRGGEVAGLRYLERRSAGAAADERLPMVVVFHSRAATPEGFAGFHGNLHSPARVILPEGPGTLAGKRSWFALPARTSDQEELEAQMRQTGKLVAKFLRAIRRCRPTIGRPIVTGSSQGASMSYLMANLYPSLVHAAVPAIGWIPRPLWRKSMARTTAFHGTEDRVIPYERTKAEVDRMRGRGAPIDLSAFPVGHSVSSDMARSWRRVVNAYLGELV